MTSPNPKLVPLDRVAKFIRQLTHDVRNGLSAIDLETAFIAEIATDEEVLTEVRKLREMVADAAKMLRNISQRFQPVAVHPIPWAAATMMEELRKSVQTEFPEESQAIEIENLFGAEAVYVDLHQTLAVVTELLRNTFQFQKEATHIQVKGYPLNKDAVIELRQTCLIQDNPTPPDQWGLEPLLSTRPGGYGLGLFQARQIVEAQGGRLEISYTGQELVTRLSLQQEEAAKS